MLSPAERRTLAAVADAFLPALTPEPGNDPQLFGLSGSAVGLPGAIEEALASLPSAQQTQFRLLLRLLERPTAMRLVAGKAARFSALSPAEQEAALLAMADSRIPQLRTAFQGFKRLATFLFYSVLGEDGTNPTWRGIGYLPSPNPPASAPLLTLTSIARATTLECEICVIGSGAGGSVVAAELAAAGRRVIVLEAGAGDQAPDYDQREIVGMQRLFLDQGLTSTRDLGLAILAGGALGGGTTVNWQSSFRTPDGVRDEWAELSGCPEFVEPSFTTSLDAVEARLSVGTGESRVNPNNAVLQRGCAALGYRWSSIPRNARGCDPPQCGYCMFGCRHGGKQSAAVTYLRDAQQAGDARIVPHCRAERVLQANGRVSGVEAIVTDPASGRRLPVHVRASTVVLAAGGIQSPVLLLRSGLELPALGRNLFLHPTTAVGGHYTERIEPWNGPPQTIVCDEFAAAEGGYGFRLETVPAHPGLMAMGLPWLGVRDHRQRMQGYAHISGIIVLTRDRAGGRVWARRDGSPVIDYCPDRRELAHLREGIAAAVRVHLAAGAYEVLTLHTREHSLSCVPRTSEAAIDAFCERILRSAVDRNRSLLFSAHQMGTCRMGGDRRTAVCDAGGEVFGVRGLFVADSSAFPASSGVNPMITVMALAHHTAQRIRAG